MLPPVLAPAELLVCTVTLVPLLSCALMVLSVMTVVVVLLAGCAAEALVINTSVGSSNHSRARTDTPWVCSTWAEVSIRP